MIMGMIAFLIFVLEQVGFEELIATKIAQWLQLPCSEAATEVFEKVHMALFGLVVLYMINCTYLIILHVLIFKGWSRVEKMSPSTKKSLPTPHDLELV